MMRQQYNRRWTSSFAFAFCAFIGSTNPYQAAALAPLSMPSKVPSVNSIVHSISKAPAFLCRPGVRKMDRFVDKIFADADTNHDDTVSLAELYELVLRLYVKLNRQAPISPPSKQQIKKIFRKADQDGDHQISRDEFTALYRVLLRRASLRLISHKSVKLLGAPLLEEVVLRTFLNKKWGFATAQRVLPTPVLAVVQNVTLWRTALLVFFVATLGNAVLALVDWCLDCTRTTRSAKRVVVPADDVEVS